MSELAEKRVLDEQVRLLYRGAMRSVSVNFAFIPVLALLLYDRQRLLPLGVWLSAVLLVTLARLATVLKGAPYDHFFEDSPRRLRQFITGICVHGLAWSAGVAWFLPHLSPLFQAYLIMLVLLGVALTMITYSTSAPAFYAFMASLAGPSLVVLVMQWNTPALVLGAITLAGCSLLSSAYWWNNRRLARAIYLRFERAGLLESLQQANENLESSNEHLEKLKQQLLRVSLTDELTGIPNRRHYNEILQKEWLLARRNRTPLSCLMIDIDYFKKYNDHYGHQKGDECIRKVAQAIQFHIKRPADLAARYGGEEFIVLLPDTPNAAAEMLAGVMARSVARLHIPNAGSPYNKVTASVGVATMIPDRDDGPELLVGSTDKALYEAKAAGRDRIMNAGEVQNETVPADEREP